MAVDGIVTELVNSFANNNDAVTGLAVTIVVSSVVVMIKILQKSIVNRLFSPKPLIQPENGRDLIPVTEQNLERKNTPLEERLALRIKATLDPAIQEIKGDIKEIKQAAIHAHECIHRIETKSDEHDEKITDKLDNLSNEFHEHIGYSKGREESNTQDKP